jgi:hypothetical protein
MGYETRIHVVEKYTFDINPKYPDAGSELATMDLCKCGDGAVGRIVSKYIKLAKKSDRKFGLYPRNPQRQQEAVEYLREVAQARRTSDEINVSSGLYGLFDAEGIEQLAADIEDGYITEDCYGDPLGVIPIQEFLEALKEDNEREPYRRYQWAIAMLEAIIGGFTDTKRLFVVTYGH